MLSAAVLLAACGTSGETPSGSSEPSPTTGAASSTAAGKATPVLVSVVAAPVPVPTTDGKRHLAYELLLANALSGDVTLKSLSVKAGSQQLLTLAGDGLAYWTRAMGATQTPTTTLGPGRAGIVWLDVVLDASAPIPSELSHTIVVDLAKPMPPLLPASMTEDGVAPVAVSTQRPVVISPPLDGPRWLDANSCCDMTAHRMAMNPLDGSLWAAERFAIDYVQVSAAGRSSPAIGPSPRATRTSAPTSTPSPTDRSSPSSTDCPSRSPVRAQRDCPWTSTAAITSCKTSVMGRAAGSTPSTPT